MRKLPDLNQDGERRRYDVEFSHCRQHNAIGKFYAGQVVVTATSKSDAIDQALKLRESSGGIWVSLANSLDDPHEQIR